MIGNLSSGDDCKKYLFLMEIELDYLLFLGLSKIKQSVLAEVGLYFIKKLVNS